jgi:serine/threonine-protein kinase HipA
VEVGGVFSPSACLDAAGNFLLSRKAAIDIVEGQLRCITDHWDAVCDEASLTETDRAFLWCRQFLNPYVLENLDGDAARLESIAVQGGSQLLRIVSCS